MFGQKQNRLALIQLLAVVFLSYQMPLIAVAQTTANDQGLRSDTQRAVCDNAQDQGCLPCINRVGDLECHIERGGEIDGGRWVNARVHLKNNRKHATVRWSVWEGMYYKEGISTAKRVHQKPDLYSSKHIKLLLTPDSANRDLIAGMLILSVGPSEPRATLICYPKELRSYLAN